jgi:hypothetical protein
MGIGVTVTLPALIPAPPPEPVAVMAPTVSELTVIAVKVQAAEIAEVFKILARHPVGTLVSDPLLMVGTEVKSIYPDLF